MTLRILTQKLVDDIRTALSLYDEEIEFCVGCMENNGYVRVKEVLEPVYHKTESGSKDLFYQFKMIDGKTIEFRRGELLDVE